jgi:hypothetical protein
LEFGNSGRKARRAQPETVFGNQVVFFFFTGALLAGWAFFTAWWAGFGAGLGEGFAAGAGAWQNGRKRQMTGFFAGAGAAEAIDVDAAKEAAAIADARTVATMVFP